MHLTDAKLNEPAIRSTLPVVSAEAGDSWVYGCSSDPRKMALMRLFMRARRKHGAAEDPAALFSFSRFLIKASVRYEHSKSQSSRQTTHLWVSC